MLFISKGIDIFALDPSNKLEIEIYPYNLKFYLKNKFIKINIFNFKTT